MPEYLHHEVDLNPEDTVTVRKTYPANVMLMDQANFDLYRQRKPYHYVAGGYFTQNEVVLQAPSKGHWHVVVDLGGGPGIVSASMATTAGT